MSGRKKGGQSEPSRKNRKVEEESSDDEPNYVSEENSDGEPNYDSEEDSDDSDDEDSGPLVDMAIPGAHFFKSLLHVWGRNAERLILKFTQSGITSEMNNQTNTIWLRFVINKEQLIRYNLDFTPLLGKNKKNKDAFLPITLNVSEAEGVFKSYKKNEHAAVFIYPGNHRIFFQQLGKDSQAKPRSALSCAILQTKSSKEYTLPDYSNSAPIVSLVSAELFASIKNSSNTKSNCISFLPFKKGFKIYGGRTVKNNTCYDTYGDVSEEFPEPEEEEETSEKIKKLVEAANSSVKTVDDEKMYKKIKIKNKKKYPHLITTTLEDLSLFSRLNSVSPESSIMRVYFEPGKPIMFEASVGQFGYYQMYLKNVKVEDIPEQKKKRPGRKKKEK